MAATFLNLSAEDVLEALQTSWSAALQFWQKLLEGRYALALENDEPLPPWLQAIQGAHAAQPAEPARPGFSSALSGLGDRYRAFGQFWLRALRERNQPEELGGDAEPLPLWLQMVEDPSLRA
jgi:hypothetical protein